MNREILIVDDRKNWRDALKSLLEPEYSVVTVSSFEEGMTTIMRRSFGLYILDFRLEDVNSFDVGGLRLLKAIKQRNPASRVILLTGYVQDLKGIKPKLKGVDRIFEKPINDINAFLSAVAELTKPKPTANRQPS